MNPNIAETITPFTHSLCINNDGQPLMDNNNILYIQNNKTGNIIRLPYSTKVAEVFGYKIYEDIETQINNNDAGASTMLPGTSTKLWTKNSILMLISLYKKHEELFKSTTIKNEAVFKIVSTDMKSEGFSYTSTQCRDKFKYLKLKYMKKKDNMSSKDSGAAAYNFDYFEQMDEIFANKANVKPLAIASNLDEVDDDSNSCSTPAKRRKLESREDCVERRHRERLEAQHKAIDTFKECMDRLIDKL